MIVRNKKSGKVYSFPRHLMEEHPEFEEYVEPPTVSVSYKELKATAKDRGLEFKGNISREDLVELLDN
jgi:effector-binding domain-containing protein